MPADIRSTVALAPVTSTALSVDGLVADASDGTRLLDGVSFVARAGAIIAIAGPTGAGKTSLAAAITGAIPLTSGAVVVGGVDVSRLESAQRGIGYVPQEDALHGELTVRQALDYAAQLRLPDCDAVARQGRVDAVLAEIRLDLQAGTRVESLSVGQRKRVSIATELLSSPAVLILDEPTSSLDPGYEATVMATLHRLADLGHSVVVVTHSEQVIASCDQVALLATGGGLAYFGAPSRMHSYFGTASAAELFTLLDEAPDSLFIPKPAEAVRSTRAIGQPRVARVSPRRQLVTLTRRFARVTFADHRRSGLFAVQGVVLGMLLLAFVTPDGLRRPLHHVTRTLPLSATGMAVLLVTSVTWLGMSNAIREIVKERHIVVRERRAGLSASAYVASKLAVLGPLVALQAAVVAAIAVQRQLVPTAGAVLPSGIAELAVTMALAGLSAVALALFVSSIVRTADKALAILPMIVVVEFVLSGLPPAVAFPGLSALRDIAGSRWAVQAIGATVTGDSQAWWHAVGALSALSATAIAGTLLAVHRSLRTRTVRRRRTALRPIGVGAITRLNPEVRRLSRAGGVALAAVALVVTGARMAFPVGSAAPVAAASASVHGAVDQDVEPSEVLASMPGLVGDMWWLLRTGTELGVGVTAMAYAASASS